MTVRKFLFHTSLLLLHAAGVLFMVVLNLFIFAHFNPSEIDFLF